MKMEEIQAIFFQECDEGVTQAETGLLALQDGRHDADTIDTIFRAVHSIKGGSGAFGFVALQTFTHHFETLLDQVRSGEQAITAALVTTLLLGLDSLADHVAAAKGEKAVPNDGDILDQIQRLVAGEAIETAPAAAPAAPADAFSFDLDMMIGAIGDGSAAVHDVADGTSTLVVQPLPRAIANGSEPLLLVRELLSIGAVRTDTDASAIPAIELFDPDATYLRWHFALPNSLSRADVEEIFEFVEGDCLLHFGDAAEAVAEPASPVVEPAITLDRADSVAPTPPAVAIPVEMPEPEGPKEVSAQSGPISPTIRVDLEKLDRLVNLVGELVITQSMLAQRLLNCGLAQISELADLDHLTRELQDSAMSIRAQPIQSVFGRVPRIVRELQQSTGKLVRLEVEGEGTELDKTVVERIGEPLTHLIRNAIDHGIETPDERIAAGKPAEGHVRLSAEHRSGRILICVSDDGRGINRERVLAKAIERGIVAADARLSDEEIDNLIFAPGFSTAETVSNISGRGVGMDVVRRNVQALGGRITISSIPGQGSTFTLALPLTLAILDGMIVTVGEQTYVVPLAHIVESLRPEARAVQALGVGQPMLNVRGSWLPVRQVAEALSIPAAQSDPSAAVLIVVESESAGAGVLMVDAIVDQRQVVIKSLETHFGPVDGVAGATILGDGRVALILDVDRLLALRCGPEIEPLRLAGGAR